MQSVHYEVYTQEAEVVFEEKSTLWHYPLKDVSVCMKVIISISKLESPFCVTVMAQLYKQPFC